MKKYLDQVWEHVSKLQAKFFQIPREENKKADRLAKVVLAEYMLLPGKVLSFVQISPLIDTVGVQEVNSESNWTTPIVSYLKDSTLPDGKGATRKLKVRATWFVMIKDVLYKRGFSTIPEMFKSRRSRLCHERSTRRDLRQPFKVAVIGT